MISCLYRLAFNSIPEPCYVCLKSANCVVILTKMDPSLNILFLVVGGIGAALVYVVMGTKIRHWLHKTPAVTR
jgi:hypothetical protein